MTIDDVIKSTRELIWTCKHNLSGNGKESMKMPTRRILAQAEATERILDEYDKPQEPPTPADDGSCDPLYGTRMDDADLGRN